MATTTIAQTKSAHLRQTERRSGATDMNLINHSTMTAQEFCNWLDAKLVKTSTMRERFALTHMHVDAPPPIEPALIEEFAPSGIDLDQNAGPTLVELCGPYGGGPDEGEWICWDVEATANSPQWSEVA